MSHSIFYNSISTQSQEQNAMKSAPSCSYPRDPFSWKKSVQKYWWEQKFVSLDFSFKPHFSASKGLLKSKERGFFPEALNFWGLVDWKSLIFHQPVLTETGKAALRDIRSALIFQEIILKELDRKSYAINYNAHHRLEPDTITQEELSQERNRLLKEHKEVDLIKKEVRESVNYTVLHFIFMQLNSNMIDQIFSDSDKTMEEKKGAKEWLFSMLQECEAIEKGVEATESMTASDKTLSEADEAYKKNMPSTYLNIDLLDRIAMHVTSDFEQLALKYQGKKSRLFFWKAKASKINPHSSSHREIQAFATQIGALIYDSANLFSSLQIERRKRVFLQKRGAAVQQISRTLQFLIQGVLAPQETRLGPFLMENKSIQDVFVKSAEIFRERLNLLKEEKPTQLKYFLYLEVDKILKKEDQIQFKKEQTGS